MKQVSPNFVVCIPKQMNVNTNKATSDSIRIDEDFWPQKNGIFPVISMGSDL